MTNDQLQAAYTSATGRPAGRVTRLPGGAGNRIYWRVHSAGDESQTAVVMELPADPLLSEEASKQQAVAELPFLNVHRYLEGIGVRVPRIYLDDHARGFVVLEDLTDRTLEMALVDGDRRQIYGDAIDQLARLRAGAERHPDPSCLAWSRGFDFELYQWEFEHFLEYGMFARGTKASDAELHELRVAFAQVSRELAAAPRSFTHRDYQSRNIMVGRGGEQIVIDFQDALQGPRQYDLVCLLRDSYVELDRPLIDAMLARYCKAMGIGDVAGFAAFFDLLTVQRKLKDAGRFVFIDQVKKNPAFLVHIPSSLRYVKDALARRPDLARVSEILAQHVPELR